MSEGLDWNALAGAHLWQSVVLATVLCLALILGRRMSGSARYAVAGSAFIAAILLPVAGVVPQDAMLRQAIHWLGAPVALEEAPRAHYSDPEFSVVRAEDGAPLVLESNLLRDRVRASWAWTQNIAGAGSPVNEAPEPAATLPDRLSELAAEWAGKIGDRTLPLIGWIWGIGAAVMIVRLVLDAIAAERMVAQATPVTLPPELKRKFGRIRVAESAQAAGPMAVGLLRPSILLPRGSHELLLDPGAAALLEHERAHIERCDVLAALVQRACLAILWWSPAIHWISRRMDEAREIACDEAAVGRTGDARAFAQSLTRQAENQLWARAPRLAVGVIGSKSQLRQRVRRLVGASRKGAGGPGWWEEGLSLRASLASLLLAALVASVVAPRITANAQEQGQKPSHSAPVSTHESGVEFEVPPAPQAPPSPPASPQPPEPQLPEPQLPEPQLPEPQLPEPRSEPGRYLFIEKGELNQEDGELADELDSLRSELEGLASDIMIIVGAELANELPAALAEAMSELDGMDLGAEISSEVSQALQEASEELRRELGPEFRAQIRQELEAAREEILEASREHRIAMVIARESLAHARSRVEASKDQARVHARDMERHAEHARRRAEEVVQRAEEARERALDLARAKEERLEAEEERREADELRREADAERREADRERERADRERERAEEARREAHENDWRETEELAGGRADEAGDPK